MKWLIRTLPITFFLSQLCLAQGAREPLDTDEAGIWMVMDKHEQMVRTSQKRIEDPFLEDYLGKLTCDLAPEHCGDIRIYVLRTPGFNASMAPNGAMFVQTGLLMRLQDESELAAVLGHEIGHYTHEHTINRLRKLQGRRSAFAVVGTAIGAAGTVAQAGAATVYDANNVAAMTDTALAMVNVAGVFAQYQLIAFGRDQETEADKIGFDRLVSAGFDPLGPSKVWDKVVAEQEAGDRVAGFSMFSTHPAPSERLSLLQERAKGLPEGKVNSNTYLEMVRKHRLDWLRDEVEVQHPQALTHIIEKQISLGLNPASGYFLLGKRWQWLSEQEKSKSKKKEALEAAVNAFASGDEDPNTDLPPEGYREWAKTSLSLGLDQEAKKYFEKYLKLKPNAWDARFIKKELSKLSK